MGLNSFFSYMYFWLPTYTALLPLALPTHMHWHTFTHFLLIHTLLLVTGFGTMLKLLTATSIFQTSSNCLQSSPVWFCHSRAIPTLSNAVDKGSYGHCYHACSQKWDLGWTVRMRTGWVTMKGLILQVLLQIILKGVCGCVGVCLCVCRKWQKRSKKPHICICNQTWAAESLTKERSEEGKDECTTELQVFGVSRRNTGATEFSFPWLYYREEEEGHEKVRDAYKVKLWLAGCGCGRGPGRKSLWVRIII